MSALQMMPRALSALRVAADDIKRAADWLHEIDSPSGHAIALMQTHKFLLREIATIEEAT